MEVGHVQRRSKPEGELMGTGSGCHSWDDGSVLADAPFVVHPA